MKERIFHTIPSLLILVTIAVVFLFTDLYISYAQGAQCNTELKNWQTRMAQDPHAADFTNIRVYKVIYSKTQEDCLLATYMVLPAGSPSGEALEWLEINSLGTQGATHWFQTYSPMSYSEATKILDEQITALH